MFKKINRLALIFVVVFITSCGISETTSLTSSGSKATLATVNDDKITENDVVEMIKPQMNKVELEIYKIKKDVIDQLIEEKLIEQASATEGKTPEVYLNEYLTAKVKEPTEDEIKRFYEIRKKQMGDQKYEEAKKAVAEFIKANKETAARRRLVNQLKNAAKIDIALAPPRINIEIGNSPTRGPQNAKVTIVEFSDYQCPSCRRGHATVKRIDETYPDQIRHVFKDFPLSFHRDAQKAHEAAHCAGEQGKYWEMNDTLFENQKALSVANIKNYAKQNGLDMAKFNPCLDKGIHAQSVKNGVTEGLQAGITGTPVFFINGIMIAGAHPFASFKEVIDAELTKEK